MVYDVPRNFIGDTHWPSHGVSGSGGCGDVVVEEGDELKLDSGILVEVAEAVGKMETDLSGLIRRRTTAREMRSNKMEISGSGLLYPTTGPATVAAAATADQRNYHLPAQQRLPEQQLQPQVQRKHKSLSSLLGTPKGPHGRAVLPKQSPYEIRNDVYEYGGIGREVKRQKVDGQGSKENEYPHRSHQGVPSSPLAGRRELHDRQCVRAQNMRSWKGNEDASTYLSSEDMPVSPLADVRSRYSPNYSASKDVSEVSQRSSSPCSTSLTKKVNSASASLENDKLTGPRNDQGRKLQPQMLRIGTAKPRKMLLTESISYEVDEQPCCIPKKATGTALENSRNVAKRRRRERAGYRNSDSTETSHNKSNIPDEPKKQQDVQPLQEMNDHSSRAKNHTIRQKNSKTNNTKTIDSDSTLTLPTSPPPVLPVRSNEASKPGNSVAKNANVNSRNTSTRRTLPAPSLSKKTLTKTSISTPPTISRRAEDDTTKAVPLDPEIPPVTNMSTNVGTSTISTAAKINQPSTNKHISTLHRPFKRVRSALSNTNTNININIHGDESGHDEDPIKVSGVDDGSTAKGEAKLKPKIINNTTLIDDDDDHDDNDKPPNTGHPYEDNILSSSPAAAALSALPTSSQLSITTTSKERITKGKETTPPAIPMPMPIAEETGPWSVEALDLFDWRPPDWEERMERERERVRLR